MIIFKALKKIFSKFSSSTKCLKRLKVLFNREKIRKPGEESSKYAFTLEIDRND
jgi:hypothetical protein